MEPAKASMNQGPSFQRIRFSVIGELNGFNGRDRDEDRARSWISKYKSAFLGDQVPDDKNAWFFGESLTEPAQNCHSQLSQTSRRTSKYMLEGFIMQYGGYAVSNARHYYRARKRPDQTHLAYLHRLNGARFEPGSLFELVDTLSDVNMWSTFFLHHIISI